MFTKQITQMLSPMLHVLFFFAQQRRQPERSYFFSLQYYLFFFSCYFCFPFRAEQLKHPDGLQHGLI